MEKKKKIMEILIDIDEVTPKSNDECKIVYRVNRGLKNAIFENKHIINYLPKGFYEEGVRETDAEEIFKNSLDEGDHKYIIGYLKFHHRI